MGGLLLNNLKGDSFVRHTKKDGHVVQRCDQKTRSYDLIRFLFTMSWCLGPLIPLFMSYSLDLRIVVD